MGSDGGFHSTDSKGTIATSIEEQGRGEMKKQLPREGLIRRGPGEQDISDFGPDVEGHGIGDSVNRPIDGGTPGSDGILGLPRTGDEIGGTDEDEDGLGPLTLD